MTRSKSLNQILLVLALMLIGHAAFGQSPQPPTSSAPSSPKSDTRVSSRSAESSKQSIGSPPVNKGFNDDVISACAAAVEDLKATRRLADALEEENAALKTRLDTERQTTALLAQLNETRKSETDSLRATVAAKNEAIAAKDAVIAAQDKLIEALKKKKSSPWKRLQDVLIGAAIFAILK